MIVVGLDLSLSNTGVGIIKDKKITWHNIIPPKVKGKLTIEQELKRMRYIGDELIEVVWPRSGVNAIVIEGPSLGSRVGKIHERAGLWWDIVGDVHQENTWRVPPRSLKKYTTLNGNATKQDMIAAVNRNVNTDIKDDNAADAVALALMGARKLGKPLDPEHAVDVSCLSQMEN